MKKIIYEYLNARQKESYNFQKVSSILADYGFVTIKLNDDWNGADFIAQHIDGITYHKVQLKSRLTFEKKYLDKELYVCFPYDEAWYFYNHDELLNIYLKEYSNTMAESKSWKDEGKYTWVRLSKKNLSILEEYKIS